MKLSLIAAVGEGRVIGAAGKIPWHLPADFARFKALTMGHPVVMGRKTFESIGRPLPGRANIVITRDTMAFAASHGHDAVMAAPSLEDALRIAERDGAGEVFILGGAQIYQLAMPFADLLYVTAVHAPFTGDTFFPEIDPRIWELVSIEPHTKNEKNPFDFDFLVYKRKE